MPEPLRAALDPILEIIATLSDRTRRYDRELEALSDEVHPETKLLRRVHGVGPLTAPAFVLIIESPDRFETSRTVGAYAGLVPAPCTSREIPTRTNGSPDEETSC